MVSNINLGFGIGFNPLWLCLLTLSSNLHCGYVYWHCQVGITFQSSATWKKHIDDIYKKACFRLLLLRQVKHLLDRYSLIHIYFAFIRPVLEYGDVVWGNCTKKESDLLESVQIEAGRIITGLRCNSSRQKLYHE